MYYESVSLLQLKVRVLPCLEALSFLFIVRAVMFCINHLSQGITEISAGQNMPALYAFKLRKGLVGYLYSYKEIKLVITKLGWNI